MNMASICLRTTASFVPSGSRTHPNRARGIRVRLKRGQSDAAHHQWEFFKPVAVEKCVSLFIIRVVLFSLQGIVIMAGMFRCF